MAKRTRKKTITFGTLFQRRRGGPYYFENKAAGVSAKSLKTADSDEAVQRAIERFGHLQLKEQGKQAEALLQHYQMTQAKVADATKSRIALVDIWQRYVKALSRTASSRTLHQDATPDLPLSPAHLKSASRILGRFIRWMRDTHPEATTMDLITVAMVDEYFDAIKPRAAASYYNLTRANLRVIFKRLSIPGSVRQNPFDAIAPISKAIVDAEQTKTRKRPFSEDQRKVIFQNASDWILPAVHVAYETGLRLGDIVTLKTVDVDLGGGFISRRTRKGSKEQVFYIPDSVGYLTAWMAQQAERGEYVFPRLAAVYLAIGRKRDAERPVREFMRFLRKTCKINPGNEEGATVLGFHSLRVSHATQSRTAGKSFAEVQRQLGHSDGKTTDGYIQESIDAIKQRLVAEHKPLPLSGADPLQGIKAMIGALDAKAREELEAWLAKTQRDSSCGQPTDVAHAPKAQSMRAPPAHASP